MRGFLSKKLINWYSGVHNKYINSINLSAFWWCVTAAHFAEMMLWLWCFLRDVMCGPVFCRQWTNHHVTMNYTNRFTSQGSPGAELIGKTQSKKGISQIGPNTFGWGSSPIDACVLEELRTQSLLSPWSWTPHQSQAVIKGLEDFRRAGL